MENFWKIMIKSTGNPGVNTKINILKFFSGKARYLKYLLLGNLECPDTCLRCTYAVGVQKKTSQKNVSSLF